jgi:hypothetical protein
MSFEALQQEMTKQKERLSKYMDKWIALLLLDRWSIGVDYHAHKCEDDPGTNAEVSVLWEYKSADLAFYLPQFDGYADNHVELIVVHELCHILVNMMKRERGKEDPHEERTVTEIARALLHVDRQRQEKQGAKRR